MEPRLSSEANTWSDNNIRELITVQVLHTSLLNITGRLQSTPLGKLCTDVSASSTLNNNFGTLFVEWSSELPLYCS
jgi:hypothetical protein